MCVRVCARVCVCPCFHEVKIFVNNEFGSCIGSKVMHPLVFNCAYDVIEILTKSRPIHIFNNISQMHIHQKYAQQTQKTHRHDHVYLSIHAY